MKQFGISKKTTKTRKSYLKHINGTFAILIVLGFVFFTFFAKINDMLFTKDKIDIFKEDL